MKYVTVMYTYNYNVAFFIFYLLFVGNQGGLHVIQSEGCSYSTSGTRFMLTQILPKGKTLHTSHCSYCHCNNQTQLACYQMYENGTRHIVCDGDCFKIPNPKCSHCAMPFQKNKIKLNTKFIYPSLGCVNCKCSSDGRLGCSYMHGERSSIISCSNVYECELMLTHIKTGSLDYKCKSCMSRVGNRVSLYKPYNTWSVTVNSQIRVYCKCSNFGEIICVKNAWINRINVPVSCRNCTEEKLHSIYTVKDCNLNGITIHHNTFQYISIGSTYHCFWCSCYLGVVACSMPSTNYFKIKYLRSNCIGQQKCEKLMTSQNVTKYCSMPSLLNCPANIAMSWSTENCRLSCYRSFTPKYQVTKEKWCDLLGNTEVCQSCPEKETFLGQYGNILSKCNNSSKYIWKDKVCDGRNDCPNGTDEINCQTYYCNFFKDKDKEFVWPSVEVNTTVPLKYCQQSLWNPRWRENNFTGYISRTCSMDIERGVTEWSTVDNCGCHYEYFPMYNATTDSLQSLGDLSKGLKLVKKYASYSPNQTLYDGETIKILKLLYQTALYYNETLFVNGTDFNKTRYMIIRDMVKSNGVDFNRTRYTIMRDVVQDAARIAIEEDSCNSTVIKSELRTWISKFIREYNFLIVITKTWITTIKGPERLEKNSAMDLIDAMALYEMAEQLNISVDQASNFMEKFQKELRIKDTKKSTVEIIEDFLNAVSLVSVIVGFLMLAFFQVKNTLKVIIHKNLMWVYMVSLVVYKIPFLIEDLRGKSKVSCITVCIVLYYHILATFSWFLVEGFNLVIIFFKTVLDKKKYTKAYIAFGYGFPLLITILLSAVSTDSFTKTKTCNSLDGSAWKIIGPILCMQLITLGMFISVLKMFLWPKETTGLKVTRRTRSSQKAFIILFPLLGLPFLLTSFVNEHIVIEYVYVIVNGMTGVYLLVLHVFIDPQVKTMISKYKQRFAKGMIESSASTHSEAFSTNFELHKMEK